MITITKRALFALLLGALSVTAARAQGTYTAASCSFTDVNDCINGSGANTCLAQGSSTGATHTAVNGDTINIPSGSCTWTSGLTVPSGIGVTIIGSGTPNSTSATTGANSSCTQTSITVSGGITAFAATPQYGKATMRFSCMNIASGSGSGIAFKVLGTCTSSGCPNLRMDNITFTNWAGHVEVGISYGISAVGDMFGVVDHNTYNGVAGEGVDLIEQANASFLGVGSYGDNSWAQPEGYGSANFLFFENNLINYGTLIESEGSAGSLSNEGGGRVVGRYNTFNQGTTNPEMSWHGTESNGRPRSERAWEFYENTVNCAASSQCYESIGSRGGTGLTWGNTINIGSSGSPGYMSSFVSMNTYRTQGSIGGWGACDGSSAWDTNGGTTYYSGTISSVSSNVITVSGSPGWSTNQWVPSASFGEPYSVHDVTQNSGSEITANGSNTLTYGDTGGPGQYSAASGDSIEILRATVCIDQAGGRGEGYLYSGTTPQSTPADEVPSPVYEWMDTFNYASPSSIVWADTARVIANRDWYAETANQGAQTSASSPFNGSSGVGHGTLANRPTSCTASSNGGNFGVAYWETDQNQLDFCIGANTWSTTSSTPASYVPYTYPHPLTVGSANPPAPPSNVRAVAH